MITVNFQGWTAKAAMWIMVIFLIEFAVITWRLPTGCEGFPAYCEMNVPFNRLMACALGVLAIGVAIHEV